MHMPADRCASAEKAAEQQQMCRAATGHRAQQLDWYMHVKELTGALWHESGLVTLVVLSLRLAG